MRSVLRVFMVGVFLCGLGCGTDGPGGSDEPVLPEPVHPVPPVPLPPENPDPEEPEEPEELEEPAGPEECAGNEDSCGTGGTCTACGPQQRCQSGECVSEVLLCGPGNCAGCCDANGACQTGSSVSACGVSGSVCAVCVGECVSGTCVDPDPEPQTCAETCAGCCDGEVCLAGTAVDVCGAAGRMCQVCESGEECREGACLTPGDAWRLTLLDGQLTSTSAPAPQVWVWVNAGGTWYESSRRTTHAPVWNESVVQGVTRAQLLRELWFEVWTKAGDAGAVQRCSQSYRFGGEVSARTETVCGNGVSIRWSLEPM